MQELKAATSQEEIDFSLTEDEKVLVKKIAERAKDMLDWEDTIDTMMDITAAHNHACRIRLKELLEADDFNFIHDVEGIRALLDRNTGKLTRGFLPRFAQV